MKRSVITSLFMSLLAVAVSHAQPPRLPQWQEGYMDIHLIATGRGDASFVIMPDGTKMLIDCGDVGYRWEYPILPDDSRTPAQWVDTYIRHFSAGTPSPGKVDYFLLSHFHTDHMGNTATMKKGKRYGLCGVTEIAEYLSFGKWVDRDWPSYDFPSEAFQDAVTGKFMVEYRAFVPYQQKKRKTVFERFEIGSDSQFTLVNDPQKYAGRFEIRNLGARGESWTGEGLQTQVNYDGGPEDIKDENWMSCVIKITYGDFSYYTGGDLPGGYFEKKSHEFNCDFETPVAKVCGPVTAMRVNHHAANNSTNYNQLMLLQPQTLVITSARYTQPNYSALMRMADQMVCPGEKDIFCNCDAARNTVSPTYYKNITAIGHIVIRVYEDGRTYQVFVLENTDPSYPVKYMTPVKNSLR